MKVLITGGQGFIGRNLQDLFQQHGISYISLDEDLAPRSLRFEDSTKTGDNIVWGDISIRLMTSSTAEALGITHIVHLAAVTGVQTGLSDPWETWRVNVGGSINVLERARLTGVKKTILVSSVAAGWASHPYAVSKRAMELAGDSYRQTYGLDVINLRLPNMFGPHSQHKSTVVSQFIQQAIAGEPLTINGDGSQFRHFLAASEACEIICRMLCDDPLNRTGYSNFELDGYPLHINHLAELVLKTTGSQSETVTNPIDLSVEPPNGVVPVLEDNDWITISYPEWDYQHTVDKLIETVAWFRKKSVV